MSDAVDAPLELAELSHLLETADAGAVLAPPRLLRRIIKRDRKLPGIGLQVPHRKAYVIDRAALFRLADEADLQLGPGRQLPETVTLIARPDVERLAALPRHEALLKYWRLLFHSRVHIALEQRVKEGKLTEADVRARIHRIGQTEFDEVRGVLRQENFVLPPRHDTTYYIEFVALFLDLQHFTPSLLRRYFPALRERADIRAILAQDLDVQAVLQATRLAGSPDPKELPAPFQPAASPTEEEHEDAPATFREHSYHRLIARADRARTRGNVVRAAILRRRAVLVAGSGLAPQTLGAARKDLEQLATRLQAALSLSVEKTQAWREALFPLLKQAAHGMWPVEARLLYDLQKACTEHERETYALDVVGWIVSVGKLPVKRLLPNHRAVLIARHLRSAMQRLPATRISGPNRRALAGLLHHAVEQSELRLRALLRPSLVETLNKVNLEAQNFPEQAGRHKLVEELLDLVVARGYVTIGDLRDAISRNNVKLPDLANADEFFLGDRLIRTNRRLAVAWDGVYRRGEVYLRWLQRLSSLAFATRPGRFLTRYLVMPFGVAYVALEGALHLQHVLARWTDIDRVHLAPRQTFLCVLVLGLFLFALMHSAGFRSGVVSALASAYKLLRTVLVEAPAYVLRLPIVRRLLDSESFAVFRNIVLKPLVVTGVTALVYPLYGVNRHSALLSSGVIFALACLFLNTRIGHMVEESLLDALVKTWQRLRLDVFPAFYALTMSLFRGLIEAVEGVIYTVDEWLRFRTGQGRFTLAAKTVLAFLWFFITYLVRIYVNLFVEPTVNPIKHFPVVTVAAKLIVPFFGIIFPLFETPFLPLGPAFAKSMATLNIILLPGIFGFLVWELKENWRLYRGNRSAVLKPAIIGHHGETMSRLLQPGFHSGTIPSLYAKLRRAERKSYRSGAQGTSHKYREALHHIEERVRRFVDREFLYLLHGSSGWQQFPVRTGKISICSNRIAIEFTSAADSRENVWIAFEERTGWLVASVANTGWLSRLDARQLAVWSTALAGLYKLGSVDLVREQIEACFPAGRVTVDVLPEGLVVWPTARFDVQAVYHLRDGAVQRPSLRGENTSVVLPSLSASRVIFRNMPITWERWVAVWNKDQAGQRIPLPLSETSVFLPRKLALSAP